MVTSMVFPARSVLIWISPALSRSEYYVPAVKRISDAVYLPEDLALDLGSVQIQVNLTL